MAYAPAGVQHLLPRFAPRTAQSSSRNQKPLDPRSAAAGNFIGREGNFPPVDDGPACGHAASLYAAPRRSIRRSMGVCQRSDGWGRSRLYTRLQACRAAWSSSREFQSRSQMHSSFHLAHGLPPASLPVFGKAQAPVSHQRPHALLICPRGVGLPPQRGPHLADSPGRVGEDDDPNGGLQRRDRHPGAFRPGGPNRVLFRRVALPPPRAGRRLGRVVPTPRQPKHPAHLLDRSFTRVSVETHLRDRTGRVGRVASFHSFTACIASACSTLTVVSAALS